MNLTIFFERVRVGLCPGRELYQATIQKDSQKRVEFVILRGTECIKFQ
jgi:hypothetical protein